MSDRSEKAAPRTHQPGQARFYSILPEDIAWQPFPAFPPSARLAVRCVERAVPLSLAALIAGGCANVQVASPLDDPRAPTTSVRRCSPDDPNRSVWFCKVGQLIYNIVGSGQVSGGYTIR